MQIVRHRNTFIAYYKFDNEVLELNTTLTVREPNNPDGYRGRVKFRVLDMNSGEHEIEIVEDTPLFVGGAMKYDNGWFITDQERYDEALQRERDKRIVEVKERHIQNQKAPIVDTGLGYSVDGARENKDDFYSKWDVMGDLDTTTVRDSDNNFHPNITRADMRTIYEAIVTNGEALLAWKWNKEAEVQATATIEELRAVVI